jgi:hypothetical protein
MTITRCFLLAMLFSGVSAGAQIAGHQPLIRINQMPEDHSLPAIDQSEKDLLTGKKTRTANKGAGLHKRTYNYIDHLALNNGDIRSSPSYVNIPYMWYAPDMYAMYDGLLKDTIRLTSYGMVFQPYWFDFNNRSSYGVGTMLLEATDNYAIDSVIIYGVYRRNVLKTGIVDTLRIAYTYGLGIGTNIPDYFYPDIAPRYTVDTLISAVLHYDTARHILQKPDISSGPAILYQNILLHAADTAISSFSIAPALPIPAGNLFGVTVTFRSGDTYIPYSDTAFLSTAINPDNPYKYGMFRPGIYKERPTGFPIYVKHNYNSGQFVQLPESPTPVEYTPTWLWSANGAASNYQFPDIDFVVSCPTCLSLDVTNTPPLTIGDPYPNPSDQVITIPLTSNTAGELTITVTNALGQPMSIQQPNSPNNKNIHIVTRDWPSGIYFIAAHVNGYRTTSRFVVTH